MHLVEADIDLYSSMSRFSVQDNVLDSEVWSLLGFVITFTYLIYHRELINVDLCLRFK